MDNYLNGDAGNVQERGAADLAQRLQELAEDMVNPELLDKPYPSRTEFAPISEICHVLATQVVEQLRRIIEEAPRRGDWRKCPLGDLMVGMARAAVTLGDRAAPTSLPKAQAVRSVIEQAADVANWAAFVAADVQRRDWSASTTRDNNYGRRASPKPVRNPRDAAPKK